MEKILNFVKKEPAVILLVLLTLGARLLFLSPWLEDWDSVQFALALHSYDIANHQPHAPGYPLYVLLGRALNLLLQNDLLSLTLLSALFGAFAIIPLYLFARRAFDKRAAILSSIFFAVTPIAFMMSEVALTNIVGLFFLIVFAHLLYVSAESQKKLVFVSGFAGVILGVRATELPIIAALLVLVHLRLRKPKSIFYSIIAFLIGLSFWVVPILIDTGFKNFIEEYSWISNYVLRHDALLGQSAFSFSLLYDRLKTLWSLISVSYTPYFFLFSILAFLVLAQQKSSWRKFNFQFLTVWFLAYLLPLAFFFNLEVPRYTLPLLPPLAVFAGVAINTFSSKQKAFILFFLVLAATMFSQSWSQVSRFKTSIPPTIAPVLYVKEQFKPEEVIIISSFTYRQFQYYAPGYKVFYVDKIDKISIPDNTKVVIDHWFIRDKFPSLHSFLVDQKKEFSSHQDISSRVPKTSLFVLVSPK